MRKLLVILAAAGLMLAMSSCSKKCTCRYYAAGEEIMTPDEIEVGMGKDFKNCADLQESLPLGNYDEATKSGVKCE